MTESGEVRFGEPTPWEESGTFEMFLMPEDVRTARAETIEILDCTRCRSHLSEEDRTALHQALLTPLARASFHGLAIHAEWL